MTPEQKLKWAVLAKVADVIEDRAALESACEFIEQHVAPRKCDSDGVSHCWRCNSVYLASRMRELLKDVNRVCPHGIHMDNACGACVPPRGTTVSGMQEVHDCCNPDCTWRGPRSETCMLGKVGPLCPECREVTEPDMLSASPQPPQVKAVPIWQPEATAPKDGTEFLAWFQKIKLDDDDNMTDEVVGGAMAITSFTGGSWNEPDWLDAHGSYWLEDWCFAEKPVLWHPTPPEPVAADYVRAAKASA